MFNGQVESVQLPLSLSFAAKISVIYYPRVLHGVRIAILDLVMLTITTGEEPRPRTVPPSDSQTALFANC